MRWQKQNDIDTPSTPVTAAAAKSFTTTATTSRILCACIHRIHCVTQPLKCRCCSSSKDSPRFMPRDSPSEQTTRKAGREGISGRPAPILADYNLILSGRESCRCVMLLQNTQRVISPLTDGLGDECRNKDFRRKARTFFFHE